MTPNSDPTSNNVPDSCQERPYHPRLHPRELVEIYSDLENSKAYHYLQDLRNHLDAIILIQTPVRNVHVIQEFNLEKSNSFKGKSTSFKEKSTSFIIQDFKTFQLFSSDRSLRSPIVSPSVRKHLFKDLLNYTTSQNSHASLTTNINKIFSDYSQHL